MYNRISSLSLPIVNQGSFTSSIEAIESLSEFEGELHLTFILREEELISQLLNALKPLKCKIFLNEKKGGVNNGFAI